MTSTCPRCEALTDQLTRTARTVEALTAQVRELHGRLFTDETELARVTGQRDEAQRIRAGEYGPVIPGPREPDREETRHA